MTERPYTDEDLRAEAARQLATATTDPDFMGIGEQMEGAFIESTVVDPDPATGTEPVTGRTWDELDEDSYDAAQRAVDDLLGKAADISEWAVDLGADGLVPDEHSITIGGEQTAARIHFAFAPGLDDGQRAAIVHAIAHHIGDCNTCNT